MRPRAVQEKAGRLQQVDRLAVQRLGCVPSIKEGPRADLDPPCPRSAAGAGRFAQQLKSRGGTLAATAAAGGFDQLHQCEGREPQLMWVGGRLRGRGERLLIAGQAVVEHGGHPLRHRESHPLAVGDEALGAGSDQPCDLVLTATEGGQCQGPVRGDDATIGGLGEGVRLLDQRRGRRQLSREDVDPDTGTERQREVREGADLTGSSDLLGGQRVPAFVVPDESRCPRSEEHTSELQSRVDIVCRLLLEKKKKTFAGGFDLDAAKRVGSGHWEVVSYEPPSCLFLLIIRRPPTSPLFPYTTLFR